MAQQFNKYGANHKNQANNYDSILSIRIKEIPKKDLCMWKSFRIFTT